MKLRIRLGIPQIILVILSSYSVMDAWSDMRQREISPLFPKWMKYLMLLIGSGFQLLLWWGGWYEPKRK